MKSTKSIVIKTLLLITMIQGIALAGPKLTMSQMEFDFGYVPQAAKISHDFWLYSKGDDTLKILNVSPG